MNTTLHIHIPLKEVTFREFDGFISIDMDPNANTNLFVQDGDLDASIESAEKIVSKLKERKENLQCQRKEQK